MTKLLEDEKQKKNARRAAVLGACLAVLCHLLPHEYQAPCATILKAAAITCGGGH